MKEKSARKMTSKSC